MKKGWLFLIVLAGISISVGIPFLISNDPENAISLVASLLSAVAAVITMALAILLFGRFGVEIDILRRQFDAVNELLETMSRFVFILSSEYTGAMYRVDLLDPLANQPLIEEYDRRIAFTEQFFNRLESFRKASRDIYMPVPIATALECVIPSMFTSQPSARTEKALVLGRALNKGDESIFFADHLESAKVLHDYLIAWAQVVDSIDLCIKENAANSPELNIRHSIRSDKKS